MTLSGNPHIVITIETDLHRPAGFVSRTDSLSKVTENGYVGVEGDKKIGDLLRAGSIRRKRRSVSCWKGLSLLSAFTGPIISRRRSQYEESFRMRSAMSSLWLMAAYTIIALVLQALAFFAIYPIEDMLGSWSAVVFLTAYFGVFSFAWPIAVRLTERDVQVPQKKNRSNSLCRCATVGATECAMAQ